jgi:hypothetical protein
MKIVLLCGLLMVGTLCAGAESKPEASYPIKVHVISSELHTECEDSSKGSTCPILQFLTVLIDGKKYQLKSAKIKFDVLPRGDYQARITRDKTQNSTEYSRIYELRLPEGKATQFLVIGESE